ncbi:MAG: tRNA (adenosine(37)-N6)-threonylcarbamoyltransferase complex ATPase subunit type 1 TsaE [Kiritimatiellae bacterium]|nr:tRNA (adenosine(37)-N6)-threonylcarbamoyltransferase complex ATPase subunit type 1 TsaE [Kiritimatiellia bacterium]
MQKRFETSTPEATQEIAQTLGMNMPRGTILALHGPLGAGKTCFVKGLASAQEISHPITSPTFTIINEYQGRMPLYHIDLYRLSGPDEALALGLEDYLFGDGITAIEWPDRAGDLLPVESTIHVELIQPDDATDERCILVTIPDELAMMECV